MNIMKIPGMVNDNIKHLWEFVIEGISFYSCH